MDIAIIASELAPFSKTGGLADVCGALATELSTEHRVITVSPLYRCVPQDSLEVLSLEVTLNVGQWPQTVRFAVQRVHEQLVHVFIVHDIYSERDGIYGDKAGSFGDNHIRFGLLCRAALEAVRRIPIGTEVARQDDLVLHIHDWQTALVPAYLDTYYRPLGLFKQTPTVLTLHNPAHQGRLPASLFPDFDLPPRWFRFSGLEFHGDLGMLKAGCLLADKLTTVSPTFAWEITTPDGGFGLDTLFRGRFGDLTGILNGIDTQIWDPATDPHIAVNFSAANVHGKSKCKAALQRELGLPVDEHTPLFGNVGRLDPQKGIDMLIDSIPWLASQGAQVVVLGSAAAAHKRYEERLRELEHRFPQNVRAWIGYNEPIAHRIEAGSDFFIMPSLFEPCGLNQLYSMRYGAVPIVRRTGGLADSVIPYDPWNDGGTGFVFSASQSAALRDTLWKAISLYRDDPAAYRRLQQRGLDRDSSWAAAVAQYEVVYQAALSSRNAG